MRETDGWLHHFPALADLAPTIARKLHHIRPMRVPAGTVLFRDGDACRGYVLVLRGSIRVQKMDPDGHEIVLYRVEDGQTCMLTTACLLGNRNYPAEGIAEEETELVLLPPPLFNELLSDATFRRFALGMISERIADLMALIEDVAFGRMDVRLARRLIEMDDGSHVIGRTHQQLATELGTAREVISRLLKDFERRGWVRLRRGEIRIVKQADIARLAREQV